MSKEKVIIIIPTYNEEENIAQTLEMLLEKTHDLCDYQVELLVFDSQSEDATAEIVQKISTKSERVHFIQESQKTGLGSAYLQAMRIAMDHLNADVVFECDADGSHQPCYLVSMLELLKEYDAVVGSRYIPKGSVPKEWGIKRKFFSIAGNWVARLFLTRRYKDLTSGFRGIRTALLKTILPKKFLSNHYAYKLQLAWLLYQANARMIEYPIVFIDREKGRSKLPKNSIADALYVISILRYQQLCSLLARRIVALVALIQARDTKF